MSIRLALAVALVSLPSLRAAEPHSITVEDIWQVRRVGTPAVSPDGKWCAVDVTTHKMESNDSSTDLWLLATDGLAVDRFARELDAEAAARTRLFTSRRAPWGFYGYEAAALILDAIAEAGGDRAGVVATARGTRDRDSALGRYSIDEDGLATAPADGILAVVEGEIVWKRAP